MFRLRVLMVALVVSSAWTISAGSQQTSLTQPTSPTTASVVIPAGVQVQMALTRPVWSNSVKVGDALYAQTVFPVTVGNQIAIPAGSYIETQIDALTLPTRKSQQAVFDVEFKRIIYADGYVVVLAASSGTRQGANVTVKVSNASDILLDNGSQIAMTLEAPLQLNAHEVAQAVPLSKAPKPGSFVPATLCRPTPGDPGNSDQPDTVIPGDPGTPSTTIPGMDGAPDMVIPGTPPTPATTIPGTKGTPATPPTYCPAPPVVLSSTPDVPPTPPVVTAPPPQR